MQWLTRSHVHVDRVACPWLIMRFVDNEAEFLFVPKNQIERVAKETGAIPFAAARSGDDPTTPATSTPSRRRAWTCTTPTKPVPTTPARRGLETAVMGAYATRPAWSRRAEARRRRRRTRA